MSLVVDSFGSENKSLVYVTECEEDGSDQNGTEASSPKIQIRSLSDLVRKPEICGGQEDEKGKTDGKKTSKNDDDRKVIAKSSDDEWETEFQNFMKTKEISCQNKSIPPPDEDGLTFMELQRMPMMDEETDSGDVQSNPELGDNPVQGESFGLEFAGSCIEATEANDANGLKQDDVNEEKNAERLQKKKKSTLPSVSKRSFSYVQAKRNLEKLQAEKSQLLESSSSSKKVKENRKPKKEKKRPLVTLKFAYNDKPKADMTPSPPGEDDFPTIPHSPVSSPAESDDSQATLPISKFKPVKLKRAAATKSYKLDDIKKSKEPVLKSVPKKPKPKKILAKEADSEDDSFLKNFPFFELQNEPLIELRNKGWSAKVDEAVGQMYHQISKGIATFSRMKELMELSWPYRKAEYNRDPDVPTNFRNFPALLDPRLLKEDLGKLKNLNWSSFERKLANMYEKTAIKKCDSDPVISSAIEQLHDHGSDSDLVRDVKLLIWAHRKCKGKLYADLYEQLNESDLPYMSDQLTPTIDLRGDLGDPDKKIYVYCERVLVSVAPNMYQAILATYAMYWLYGITYEPSVQPLFETFDKLSGLS